MSLRRTPLFLALASTSLFACAAPPDPVPAPAPLELARDHFAGSIRSGPLAVELDPTEAEAAPWTARMSVSYVTQPLDASTGSEPVSSPPDVAVERLALRVVVDEATSPVRPVADLARGIRMSTEAHATGEALWSAEQGGVLWPGSTASFTRGGWSSTRLRSRRGRPSGSSSRARRTRTARWSWRWC